MRLGEPPPVSLLSWSRGGLVNGAVQNSTITSHDGGRMVEVTVSLVVRDSLVPSTVNCYGSTYRAVHNNTVQSQSGISCFKA